MDVSNLAQCANVFVYFLCRNCCLFSYKGERNKDGKRVRNREERVKKRVYEWSERRRNMGWCK